MTFEVRGDPKTPRISVRLEALGWFGVYAKPDGELDLRFLPAAEAAAFQDAWTRYHAERAKRSVVVSAATMRSMDDFAGEPGEDVLLMHSGFGQLLSVARYSHQRDGHRWWRLIDHESILIAGKGWWPLPNLTPMPEEFAAWNVGDMAAPSPPGPLHGASVTR